ncbi:minor capsid protein [Solibacillus sp. MA9]|uniref:Minor capsid protein n=1 Tax=Solibacillus palustris TaxID=2908203 RepID=A0ABS9UBQ7_9BACL|nr:minor capsid protein [Solibacillus sp. MA9]MCH7321772.1 minor capsid protein [Solibacillus sp. MA9]
MSKKSRNYWRLRFEALEDAQHKRSIFYYADLEKAYIKTINELEKDILKWYSRFATNNEISLDEAKRLLKSDELREFQWTVKEYIEYGKKNALNQQWMKQLENASSRVHISRLEGLRIQLQQHVERLYGDQIEGFERLMKEVYQEQYYHTAFEVQKAFNVGFTFQKLDEARLTKIISKPWTADNLTFSAKIWRDRGLLIDTLHKELLLSIAKGESPHRLISVIQKKMNTSRSNASRLVLTEQAFFSASASKDAYGELDVEQYEIIATLDHKTSEICQSLDGKIFKQSDFEPGVTANPFHPRCRSTTAPYFEDDYGTRIARDLEGKTYYVPSDMKYEEWYQTQVDKHGEQKIAIAKKKESNKISDKLQFDKMKEIIGKQGPNSLDAFQNLKYNNSQEWNLLNDYKKSRENNMISPFTSFDDYILYKNRINNELIGITTPDGTLIKAQSKHFIERVFGTNVDPHTKRARNGVSLEEIKEALLNGNVKERANQSKLYVGNTCEVSVNPETGNLIQVNPISSRRRQSETQKRGL